MRSTSPATASCRCSSTRCGRTRMVHKPRSRERSRHSIEQVKELRRALDLLASRPGVDGSRLIYVGHDFGAMYGALVAGVEAARLKAFVFMAGTQILQRLVPALAEAGRGRQRAGHRALAPLDPLRHLRSAGRLPMLFQFATRDKFVTKAAADALVASAAGPQDVRWYDAEHELNAEATRDRVAWLRWSRFLQAPSGFAASVPTCWLKTFIASATIAPMSATFAGSTRFVLPCASWPNCVTYCSATRSRTASCPPSGRDRRRHPLQPFGRRRRHRQDGLRLALRLVDLLLLARLRTP